ncbi:MAG: glycosyltransferase [Firmicutes bacterium]|nr:glycosyltransferase [Bacillota bacterium]
MKLSITMMVKNEEKYLEQCLQALIPIMKSVDSELIIVDTGSNDKTVEIAKKYTDKVYFHAWNNDFADMRNKTIQYAKGEWLLILDGDEIITDPSGIISFLNSKESKKYNTGMLTIKNITNKDDDVHYVTSYALRLFKNNNFYYEGAIHEQPQYQLPIVEIKTEIEHYGYLATDEKLMEYKFERNIKLLKSELEKDPENIYYWYQLSQSYGMYKDYKKALEASLKAYKIAKSKKADLKKLMYVYHQLALAYYWNKKYVELEKICKEAMSKEKGYLDLYFYLAEAQKELQKEQAAIKNYELYLKLISENSYVKDPSVTNKTISYYEYVYLYLCELYRKQNELRKALKYVKRIKTKKIFSLALPQIIKIYVKLKYYKQLKEFYVEKIENKEEVYTIFWGALENVLGELEEDEKIEIIEIFSTGNSEYALLNKVRLALKQNNRGIDEILLVKVKKIDFHSLPIYFADIIYWLIKNSYTLTDITNEFRENLIKKQISYLAKKHSDFSEIMLDYLRNCLTNKNDVSLLKINKEISKWILLLDKIHEDDYRYVVNRYIEDGTSYILQIYNRQIIDNQQVCNFKDDEDAFLFYMLLAQKNKDDNKLESIKNLRKALKVFPEMKKTIEILLEDEQKQGPVNTEMEILKKQFKDNIQFLISNKTFAQAEELIKQYEKMVSDDIEILFYKSQIYLAKSECNDNVGVLN